MWKKVAHFKENVFLVDNARHKKKKEIGVA